MVWHRGVPAALALLFLVSGCTLGDEEPVRAWGHRLELPLDPGQAARVLAERTPECDLLSFGQIQEITGWKAAYYPDPTGFEDDTCSWEIEDRQMRETPIALAVTRFFDYPEPEWQAGRQEELEHGGRPIKVLGPTAYQFPEGPIAVLSGRTGFLITLYAEGDAFSKAEQRKMQVRLLRLAVASPEAESGAGSGSGSEGGTPGPQV